MDEPNVRSFTCRHRHYKPTRRHFRQSREAATFPRKERQIQAGARAGERRERMDENRKGHHKSNIILPSSSAATRPCGVLAEGNPRTTARLNAANQSRGKPSTIFRRTLLIQELSTKRILIPGSNSKKKKMDTISSFEKKRGGEGQTACLLLAGLWVGVQCGRLEYRHSAASKNLLPNQGNDNGDQERSASPTNAGNHD